MTLDARPLNLVRVNARMIKPRGPYLDSIKDDPAPARPELDMVLDFTNAGAYGAIAVLDSTAVTVRRSYKLTGAPIVKMVSGKGRGHERVVPQMLVIGYSKWGLKDWRLTMLRVYGHVADKPVEAAALNIYNHSNIDDKNIPAWIRDAAIAAKPEGEI
jgi:hypothetical protein